MNHTTAMQKEATRAGAYQANFATASIVLGSQPTLKKIVIPECFYRGYGFLNNQNYISTQSRRGNDKIT
jgi:hypothetical protein